MFLFYFRQAHNIDEDIPIGTSILKVKASDADSGSNADIAYSVSDDHFAVDSSGVISNNRRLDADSNNAYYEFQVQLWGRIWPETVVSAPLLAWCLDVWFYFIKHFSREFFL